MSATNRGAKRREADFYPTPDELAERIVRAVGRYPNRILEPSAGDGAFVRACRANWRHARVSQVEPGPHHFDPEVDGYRATIEEFAARLPDARFDLIIGNPPFSLAEEHVRLCIGMLAPGGRLVFLLRLAFLETKKRAKFWCECPPARITVLEDRPSFCWSWSCKAKHKWTSAPGVKHTHCPECGSEKLKITKTDACAYAVFEWRQGFAGKPELGWI